MKFSRGIIIYIVFLFVLLISIILVFNYENEKQIELVEQFKEQHNLSDNDKIVMCNNGSYDIIRNNTQVICGQWINKDKKENLNSINLPGLKT